jgi:(hydroxyamino)benzene mutase
MTPSPSPSPAPFGPTERLLGASAAVLFLVALLTGLFAGAAMTGKIPADGHAALAAHLNALMGTFLLVSFAWTLPMLHIGPVGKRRLAVLFVGTSFANWAVTTLKALLFVGGLEPSGQAANMLVFALLQATVVLPGIGGAGVWVWGFRAPKGSAP